MKDSKGKDHEIKINVLDANILDKMSSFVIKFINDREHLLDRFKNFHNADMKTMDLFSGDQKKRL